MRPSDRLHLVGLMQAAMTGALTRSDVVAIFMYIRAEAPVSSVIRDIGHTVAHDQRDRGIGFEYVRTFVDHVRTILTSGGVLDVGIVDADVRLFGGDQPAVSVNFREPIDGVIKLPVNVGLNFPLLLER